MGGFHRFYVRASRGKSSWNMRNVLANSDCKKRTIMSYLDSLIRIVEKLCMWVVCRCERRDGYRSMILCSFRPFEFSISLFITLFHKKKISSASISDLDVYQNWDDIINMYKYVASVSLIILQAIIILKSLFLPPLTVSIFHFLIFTINRWRESNWKF